MTVDAVLFDYGGVLTNPVKQSISAWLATDGIEPLSFQRILRAWLSRNAPDGTPIHRLETGELPVAKFEALLAAELATFDGGPVDPRDLLSRLFAEMRPDPAMFTLATELRELGIQVGMVSNSWGNTYPRERIDALFDPIVISGEIGLRKPLAPIYELAVERLCLPAGRVLFIDDAEPNLVGARGTGLQALLHTDGTSTRATLAQLLPGLSPEPRAVASTGAPHDHSD